MVKTDINDKDARSLIGYLLSNDSVNINRLVNTYIESTYSAYSNERTTALMESISSKHI